MTFPKPPRFLSGRANGERGRVSKFPMTVEELKAAGYERVRQVSVPCKACNAQIEFWRTPHGKMIPLDVGTLAPHWATCPEAKRFRTPRLGFGSGG